MRVHEILTESLHQQILTLLQGQGLPMSALAQRLGVMPTEIQPVLQQLVHHGTLNMERGRGEPFYVINRS